MICFKGRRGLLVQTDRKLNGNFSVLNDLVATGKVETTHLKMLLVKGNRPYAGFEFKYSNSPKLTKGSTEAMKDLNCPHQYIVTPSAGKFEMRAGLWVIGISDIPEVLRELDVSILGNRI